MRSHHTTAPIPAGNWKQFLMAPAEIVKQYQHMKNILCCGQILQCHKNLLNACVCCVSINVCLLSVFGACNSNWIQAIIKPPSQSFWWSSGLATKAVNGSSRSLTVPTEGPY